MPTLTTKRLFLRPVAMEDYPNYAQTMQSSRAAYMGGPLDERGAWGMFCHCVASWDLFGYGALMVDVRQTSETVGMVSINGGPLFAEPELGWFLFERYEGYGYATEAAAALRDWAFTERRIETLVSYFDPNNAKSLAVATRLGGVRDEDAKILDPEDIAFRYQAP